MIYLHNLLTVKEQPPNPNNKTTETAKPPCSPGRPAELTQQGTALYPELASSHPPKVHEMGLKNPQRLAELPGTRPVLTSQSATK